MKQIAGSKMFFAQCDFMNHLPDLISKAWELGFKVTGGDLYRDPRCPYGSQSSRHRSRLAIDLNLFKQDDGGIYFYCDETEEHQKLGEYWESLGGIWGGRFGDGNHYEWPIPKAGTD